MDLQAILDSKPSIFCMSEEKRQELLYMMSEVFVERPHDAVKKRKDVVFEGDINADDHILSLKRMHLYIGSYWYHQHAQLPILHKPTFNADKTPNLLLLAILAIGASTLDKLHGTHLTDTAAEFANFVVWHVRWELHRDADFRPPAKLWVFQALLLIEVYEKMYATRALHERGHIHHDATLTLMRRGSSLVGRSPYDSPPSVRDERPGRSSSGPNSAIDVPSTDESWNHWIRNEATRRVAFAAFVLDSIHATMFGHAAKMVAHEMRLPLPCDEALWSATSAAEVARVNSSLQANGIKPILFLDGLKKTLNGQRVQTNSFGRTIIMAGLLSVSWHMNQRDLQVTSLGPHNFGGRDKWRSALLRAFDNWKRDFDETLADSQSVSNMNSERYYPHLPRLRVVDDENIFESRTVLHHLAHMASHADIVDCQIYAGATRILGRSITPKDYSSVREKVEAWSHRASARDAAFYALKFLAQVLIPPANGENRVGTSPNGILCMAFDDQNMYYARDDYLLNRPWVCYFAALVVWSYGFALEGPITPQPAEDALSSAKERDRDMRDFLDRVAGVQAPDDLVHVQGKNRCLGMLMTLRESFSGTRWELTHEAARLLGSCIQKLKGQGGSISLHGNGSSSTRELSSTPSTTFGASTSVNGATQAPGRLGSVGSF
ncbi:putative c2h2 finger domain [Phaeomoniella chlamydospora]|uniref:Putative c2h2 finger domain n=1 Tax=Phaeomoniella chlamydospora TaxID=158046 RepID=A0A0G2DUX8_PHACM|nr:putative c2h2 finger domain [Phaeomoniella chlamydospora]